MGVGEGPAEVRPDPHAACLQVRIEHSTDMDKSFLLNLIWSAQR